MVLPRGERGRPGLLLGSLAAAKLNRLEADGHKSCRSPAYLKLMGRLRRRPDVDMDLFQLDLKRRRIGGTKRAQANNSGRLAAVPRAERLKGPSRLGN